MSNYQGFSRKYRPKTFAEVVGQEPVVRTMQNALARQRVSRAYLLAGMRGVGKTTLARLFAKGINCDVLVNGPEPAGPEPTGPEPCGRCASCRGIDAGHSLHVIEIDGASHRGIDDVRQLTETSVYGASDGKRKIHIIDEVHMLTKEAFNALLKTLEEPPEHAVFFLATTEPHMIPETVLSRCQRFDLRRIPLQGTVRRLKEMVDIAGYEAEEKALYLIAATSDGSLRDAESLLDRVCCLCNGVIDADTVSKSLGLCPAELFFDLDKAVADYDLPFAFRFADKVYDLGLHTEYFLDALTQHYHRVLLAQQEGEHASLPLCDKREEAAYTKAGRQYTSEQCLDILREIVERKESYHKGFLKQQDLATLLLQIIRSSKRRSLEELTDRLIALKEAVSSQGEPPERTISEIAENQDVAETDVPSSPENDLKKKMNRDKILHFAGVTLNGSIRNR